MKKIGILSAALFAASALWADDPGIALHRVQQRYPWNGLVDIDYTVSNVVAGTEANYYVRFTVTENGNAHVLHEFEKNATLLEASNGTYRVTWNSSYEYSEYRFLTKTGAVKAELVYCGDDKSNRPYPAEYVILDLAAGTNEATTVAATYPVSYVYDQLSLADATNRFNTTEYKTTKLVLRRVNAGTFTMGSPTSETGRESQTWMNKETQHSVTLTQNFLIGMFPVTQAQWTKVMGSNPANFKTDATGNPADERPVEKVSYQDIRGTSAGVASPAYGNYDKTSGGTDSFLGRLERRTGLTFDLPTEAQWEYACRAGTTSCTYIGDYTADVNVLGTICWYSGNAGGTTHGVGQKVPNAWGLYDTLGNVWEWCRDRVTVAPNDDWGTAAVTDPLRAVSGGNVPGRGGDWRHAATFTRAACRSGDIRVSYATYDCGFRLSRSLP